MSAPGLINLDGSPMRSEASTAFRAGDRLSQELASYNPMLLSPDAALWGIRDDVVARGTDLNRNNGYAAGARQSQIDNVIGANWMLCVEPLWHSLGLGDMPDEDKDAFCEYVEEAFDEWAHDPGCWIDAGRRCGFIGLLRQGFGSWWDAGEHLSVAHWLDDRVGLGRASMATAIQMISPDRLSQPNGTMDSQKMRGGIELGPYGEPNYYNIRKAHPYDPWLGAEVYQWERLPREDEFGRPVVIHGFVVEGDGMTRGVSPMASVTEAFRLQDVFERGAAKASLINTLIAATIETQSGIDDDMLKAAFSPPLPRGAAEIARAEREGVSRPQIPGRPFMLGDRTIVPKLPVGTTLKMTTPQNPNGAAYQQFTDAVLRRLAAGLGTSFEELSRDYSRTNYSSARASLLGAWKAITGRSAFIERTLANPIYALWFEEAVDRGRIVLPSMRKNGGTPSFYERRSAWLRNAWIGPGRGHVDPVKERQAYQIGRDTYTDSSQSANAEQGRDWRRTARQISRENRLYKRLGLPIATTASLLSVDGTSKDERSAIQ